MILLELFRWAIALAADAVRGRRYDDGKDGARCRD